MEIEVPGVRKDGEDTRNILRSWEKGLEFDRASFSALNQILCGRA